MNKGLNSAEDTSIEGVRRNLEAARAGKPSADGMVIHDVPHLLAEIERLEGALKKINGIRDSIIGGQCFNWSEHAYPLVAALNEAGLEGLEYPEAKENLGTSMERIERMEAVVEAARKAMPVIEKMEDAHLVGDEGAHGLSKRCAWPSRI